VSEPIMVMEMFAPEPEIPPQLEELLDEMLSVLEIGHQGVLFEAARKTVIEAFNRGRRVGKGE